MNSVEILDDCFRSMFDMSPAKERPLEEPIERETLSLGIAIKRLRKSLDSLGMKSPYWDEMVVMIRDETSNDEADRVALAIQQRESTVLLDIMQNIEQRAIRKTAELFIDQLGVVS